MDPQVKATWAGIGFTFLTSVLAIVVAFRSNKHAKDSAASATRVAIAAERQAQAAEALIPPPPLPVSWVVEKSAAGDRLRDLRNLGPSHATNVRIDAPCVGWHGFVQGETILSGSGKVFGFTTAMGQEHPTEMWITCDEMPAPVSVPIR